MPFNTDDLKKIDKILKLSVKQLRIILNDIALFQVKLVDNYKKDSNF